MKELADNYACQVCKRWQDAYSNATEIGNTMCGICGAVLCERHYIAHMLGHGKKIREADGNKEI